MRCPGTEGGPLGRPGRIREGLEPRWHLAGTEREIDSVRKQLVLSAMNAGYT